MMSEAFRILLVSDGNLANLGSVLKNDAAPPSLTVSHAPFGSVLPTLMDASAEVWSEQPDVAVIWTRPEGVLGSFADAIAGERVSEAAVLDDVDTFADAVEKAASRARWTLVPTWVPPFGGRGLGVVDLHDPVGQRALLMHANSRLAARLREVPECWVLDASAWMDAAGDARGDRRLWYAAKTPFPTPVLRAAARDIRAFLLAATGRSRKLIVLDLDHTLWGGVVGETGWQGLRLGGHDPVGEAFVDFQRALRALSRRGVILGVVSKNEESVALEAIRSHPDMVIEEQDLAGWRINWLDKATNVAELVEELRLGLDSAVFIDDQPAERARVAEALPSVLVPDWPTDPLGYVQALERLACFDVLGVSEEDVARTRSYAAERERRALRSDVSSMDDWLAQLGVAVQVDQLGPENLSRAAQLLNKTNQMNLTTRRLSESELSEWAEGPGRVFFTVRVADRFSDFGLTGLLGLEFDDSQVTVVDFVLSCRVMSRRVEEAMVHTAVAYARSVAVQEVRAVHRPTERNAPMLSFWRERSGFEAVDGHTFLWDVTNPYPPPPSITLEGAEYVTD